MSERLITELTAQRTLALRDALANDPGTAFAAVLHTLCLGAFYRMASGTCLEILAKSVTFSTQAPGLADSASAKAIEARHQQWAKQLPKDEGDLWETAFFSSSFIHSGFSAPMLSTMFEEPIIAYGPRRYVTGRLRSFRCPF